MNNCLALKKEQRILNANDVFKKPNIIIQKQLDIEHRLAYNPGLILPEPALVGGPSILNPSYQNLLDTATGKTVRETRNLYLDVSESEFEMRVSNLLERGLLAIDEETEPDFGKIPNVIRTVKAYLMLTDGCNKKCPGCYIRRGKLSMTREVGEKAIDAVMLSAKKRGFGNVKFFFFGGEPLLEWGLIRQLLDYAGKKYGKEIESNNIQFMLATNGLLLDKTMFEYLRRFKVMVLVSIGDIFNSAVNSEESKGLWDKVLMTHESLQGSAAVVAMMTATMESLPHLPDIVKKFLDNKMRGVRISLFKFSKNDIAPSQEFLEKYAEKSIKHIGESFDIIKDRLLLKKERSSSISRAYYLGFNYLFDSMSILWPKRTICGSGRTLLMVDQFGRICSCQLALDNPIGSIKEDVLEVIQKQNLEKNCFHMSTCRDCDFRYTCAGHCQKSVLHATGDYGPSVHCKIYKALIPKWLEMQGLYIARHPELPQFID